MAATCVPPPQAESHLNIAVSISAVQCMHNMKESGLPLPLLLFEMRIMSKQTNGQANKSIQ